MKTTTYIALSIAALAACSTFAMAATAEGQIQEGIEERRKARRGAAPVSRSQELTTARGQFSRRIEADIDTDNERAYRSRTVTGPEGETAGIVGEIRRTEAGTSTSQVFTDRAGDTAGSSLTRSLEDDSFIREREAHTRSGETASASDTIDRTEDGASRSTAFETSTGWGGTVESQVVRSEDGSSFSRTATDAKGNAVATRDTTVTNDEDGLSRTTILTNADGETYESSREIDTD